MNLKRQYGACREISKVAAAVLLSSSAAFAEPVTIAAMGDSLTQGYGLHVDQGFVPQLQAWLTGQGADVRLVNAGVSGDTTAGGLSRAAWTMTPDVDAMIVALGGNDVLRGIDPASSRANLSGILAAAAAQDVNVLLIGMQAPGNYGPEYKESFDSMYPQLSEQFATLFAPSFFEGLGSVDPAEVQGLMQADGIHPNAKGVAMIVDALGPHVLALVEHTSEN
ncbi:arylesterase [Cognatishimia activa]|nr:arylesterase [Cognatishimia activa]UZD92614.1 arylesterase [Cognatishimia activa]